MSQGQVNELSNAPGEYGFLVKPLAHAHSLGQRQIHSQERL